MKKTYAILLIIVFFIKVNSFSETTVDFPLVKVWQNSTNTVNLNYNIIIYNNNSESTSYVLRVYNATNSKLAYKEGTIAKSGCINISLSELHENTENIARVSVIGNNLIVLLIVSDNEGERLSAVWPPDVSSTNKITINHIAAERDQFFTSFSILANTDCNINWQDNENNFNITELNEGETYNFELGNIYQSVPTNVDIVSLNIQENQLISGFESFGNWDNKKTFAILPATSFANTRLIFPHIAYSETLYWTGLVIGNPNSDNTKITLRFMGSDGSVLQTQQTTVESLRRIVILFANENTSTPTLPNTIPDGTAWIDVFGEQPLTGFELFGGNDIAKADYMEGIRATAEPFETGIAPYYQYGTNRWTGIAIVNALSIPTSVTFSLLNSNGQVIETVETAYNPFEKKVGLLNNLFSEENLAIGSSVLIHSSVKGAIVGIVVFGDDNVTPRRLLGGYEIAPLNNNRQFGPTINKSKLPKFGVNFPKFNASEEIETPTQSELQNEFAWLISGKPYAIATRQMQSRDVFYSEWTNYKSEREEFLNNLQGFVPMPTLIGLRAEWNGIDEPVDFIDMSNEEHIDRLKAYVSDVITKFPHLKYFEILNETFGTDALGTDNFADILNTTIDTAKEINPDLILSFPHLLGTIPSLLENALDKLVVFYHNYPEILNKCDVYGIHYYGPWQQFETIITNKLLLPMENGELPSKPWVITETGISYRTSDDTITATNNIVGGPENQASYMVKMFTIGFSLSAEMSMIHSFQSGSSTGEWSGFGLIKENKERTLASCTFRYFTNAVRDFTSVNTISNGEDGIWLYRYNNATRLNGDVFVVWRDEDAQTETTTLSIKTLSGETVKVTTLIPQNCNGSVGDFANFNENEIFNSQTLTVNDNGELTINVGKYPVLIEKTEKTENFKIFINSSDINGTMHNLNGVISGPLPTPESPAPDLTEQLQSIHITSIRNNDYYDDSLDIEGIFICPDNTIYPSWECDATNDNYYYWGNSDEKYSSIVNGGFEPFLRLGGEYECHYRNHDFKGPQNTVQEDNWIIAAKKMVERYKSWQGEGCAFEYLNIWTEWPNTTFWDRTNTEFIAFWIKAFKEIKATYPEFKVGGPGILKPTVDVVAGDSSDNNLAVVFFKQLYLNNVKPDWIGFHLWKNDSKNYYIAARQFRDLLNGTGDFENMPWSGTDFFKNVEIICDAYGFGQIEDNEAGEQVELSRKELFEIMNTKRGASILASDLIAMQLGNVSKAYYYRAGDPNSSPDASFYDSNRGSVGLFYGDSMGTPKPMSNVFKFTYKLFTEFQTVINKDFISTGDNNNKIYYLACKNEEQKAILITNPNNKPVDFNIFVDNENILQNNSVEVFQIDSDNNGSQSYNWQENKLHIPSYTTMLIVF